MRKLDDDFDPSKPVQTKRGARQALLVGHNRIEELLKAGVLETVPGLGRITRITTASILKVANGSAALPDKPKPRRRSVKHK